MRGQIHSPYTCALVGVLAAARAAVGAASAPAATRGTSAPLVGGRGLRGEEGFGLLRTRAAQPEITAGRRSVMVASTALSARPSVSCCVLLVCWTKPVSGLKILCKIFAGPALHNCRLYHFYVNCRFSPLPAPR